MAGKTNLTSTLFSQKKLLAKSNTGVHRADNQEPLPSGLQVAAQSTFSQDIPASPSKTLWTVQGTNSTAEYVEFVLQPITGSTYDANSFDPDAQAQSSGPHAYRLVMTGNYESLTDNTKAGEGYYKNDQILHWTLGGLQLLSPGFSNDVPNPYTISVYSGPDDINDEIPLLDETDWYVDYFSGILFIQDYDSGKVPTRAKGFIYTGKMLNESLAGAGGGGGAGTGVGWIASGNSSISTTGSLLVGTNTATPANADISFSSIGAAVFNEQSRNADFRVEGTSKTHAFFIDASENQVLILSGGAASSTNEAVGTDINFYVSGSVGGKGGTSRSITLFGGDIHISGNLTVDGSSPGSGGGTPAGSNTQIQFNDNSTFGASSAFTFTGTEVALSAASPKYVLQRSSNDQESSLEFKGAAGVPGASISHNIVGNDLVLKTFGNGGGGLEEMLRLGGFSSGDNRIVTILSGSGVAASDMQPSKATDIAFFVSGAIGSKDTTNPGASVFGGDVVISGTLHGGSPLRVDGGMAITGTMELKPSSGGVAIVRNPRGPVKLFASSALKLGAQTGLIDLIDLNDGAAGALWLTGSGGLSNRSISLNTPGTLFLTGALGGIHTKGVITSHDGISGSLTQLADGSSYLKAGANVSITSSSNGAITIESSAGGAGFIGGDGANNQMITADGSGNIVAETNITFNGSQLEVTGNILPGSDRIYNLGSEDARFANIYTGDLHLKNERGHWQIVEEKDCLTVINRLTGKKYKMVLEPYEEPT